MKIVAGLKAVYWGWFVVAGAFLIMGVSYGTRYCFGVLIRPMSLDCHWQMSTISLGFSIYLLTYALGGLLSGYLLDRIAPRWIMTIGACITATGFAATCFVRTPGQLYLTYGLLCGIGTSGIGVVVSGASVGKWFVKRRGVALGVASIGIGIGTMALTPVVGYIVKNYHWRTGFIFLAVVILVVGVLVSQVLMRKSRPERYGMLPDGDLPGIRPPEPQTETYNKSFTAVIRNNRFWLLVICFGSAIMIQTMVFLHQVPYAIDNKIGSIAAASSLGVIGIASIFGRFFFGWLSDHISDPKYSAVLGNIVMACGMLILLNMKSVAMLYVYTIVFGFGYGSITPMIPILLADRFGRDVLGSAYGLLIFFSAGIGGSVGPMIGGIIYDRTGSYNHAWQFSIAVFILIAFLMLLLKPREIKTVVQVSQDKINDYNA